MIHRINKLQATYRNDLQRLKLVKEAKERMRDAEINFNWNPRGPRDTLCAKCNTDIIANMQLLTKAQRENNDLLRQINLSKEANRRLENELSEHIAFNEQMEKELNYQHTANTDLKKTLGGIKGSIERIERDKATYKENVKQCIKWCLTHMTIEEDDIDGLIIECSKLGIDDRF